MSHPDPTPDDVGQDAAGAPPIPSLPVTGHGAIDAALAGVTLGDDVHTHHDELVAALDAVQQALNPSPQPPLPRR